MERPFVFVERCVGKMDILVIDDERTLDVMSYLGLGNMETHTNLEDLREENPVGWNRVYHARTLIEAYHALIDYNWDVVFLDHDLGTRSDGTPAHVSDLTRDIERMAKIAERILPVDRFIIHSMNPLGRQEMYLALHKFYNVEFARVQDLLNYDREGFDKAFIEGQNDL